MIVASLMGWWKKMKKTKQNGKLDVKIISLDYLKWFQGHMTK